MAKPFTPLSAEELETMRVQSAKIARNDLSPRWKQEREGRDDGIRGRVQQQRKQMKAERM